MQKYAKVIPNKSLLIPAFLVGFSSSFVYLFATEGPFIAIEFIGIEPSFFGLLCLIPPLGLITGSLVSAKLTNVLSEIQAIAAGLCCEILGTSIMLGCFLCGLINIFTLFGPLVIIYVGHSLIFGSGAALALAQSPSKSLSSAILGFINQFMAFGVVLTFTLIPAVDPVFFPVAYLLISVCITMLWIFIRK
jgi:hypothetical protein